jgi:hypothetical protein
MGSGRAKRLRSVGHASGSQGLRRGEASCSRRRSARWCYDKNSQSALRGHVSYFHVIGVVSSFGCLHINLEKRGWQPSLGTLARLLSLFPFLFSLGFSIGLA